MFAAASSSQVPTRKGHPARIPRCRDRARQVPFCPARCRAAAPPYSRRKGSNPMRKHALDGRLQRALGGLGGCANRVVLAAEALSVV
jgi:hypothetical protein